MEELGSDQLHFPFSNKPGLNIDLDDQNKLFSERFHFLIKFLHFVYNVGYDEANYSFKRSLVLLNAGDVFCQIN
jgi:hypothetical protein